MHTNNNQHTNTSNPGGFNMTDKTHAAFNNMGIASTRHTSLYNGLCELSRGMCELDAATLDSIKAHGGIAALIAAHADTDDTRNYTRDTEPVCTCSLPLNEYGPVQTLVFNVS